MRILHIHKYYHERDGAGQYMLSLMRSQEAHGHATAVLAMHDPHNLPSVWERYFVSALDTRAPGRGIGALRQAGRALWSTEAAAKTRTIIDAFHPDIVHVHNITTHLSPSVLAACRHAGAPVVMTVHDYALVSANYALWDGNAPLAAGKNAFLRIARSRFMKGSVLATGVAEAITRLHRAFGLIDRAVDRYVTLSQFVKDTMVAVGYDARKIAVIPPSVETARTLHNIGTHALFIGRLEAYKGVETFIDAVRLCKRVPARIAGDGSLRATVRERVRDLRNVTYDGFLAGDALDAAFATARVVVVPSLWHEPFGLVALEAMARGIPVIVSDRGGLPEVVTGAGDSGTHMIGGVVVTAGDPAALAKAIQRFFDDPTFAREMGKKAKERAEAFGNPDTHFARIQAIYETCG